MIVADASFLVEVLLDRSSAVDALEEESAESGHEPLHAPELIELETLSALRRMLSARVVARDQATRAVGALGRARLLRYPHAPFRGRVWELRGRLTPYDASYLALAERLEGSRLVTCDGRLGRSAAQILGAGAVRIVA